MIFILVILVYFYFYLYTRAVKRYVLHKRLGALEHALHAVPFQRAGVPLANGLFKLLGAFKIGSQSFPPSTCPNLKYILRSWLKT